MKIPITKPFLDKKDSEFIQKPFESGWLVQGKFVKEFEDNISKYAGTKYAAAVSNCTTALHLSLIALGMDEHSTVVLPSYTYVATANSVEYIKAKLIFCDIDLNTFNISIESLKNILEKTKVDCVIPVNMFGLCANLEEIVELSYKYNFKIVEDSACGLGAFIKNKHSGSFGDTGCFSFHPRKPITTGEGGIVTTNNKEIYDKITILRDHGASKSDLERHNSLSGFLLPDFKVVGYNYRMTDMQGALGVSQFSKLDFILKTKEKIATTYNKSFSNLSNMKTPHLLDEYIHGYQSYVCTYTDGKDLNNLSFDDVVAVNKKRNQIMSSLKQCGVSTRQGGHAVHTLTYYKNKYNIKNYDYFSSFAADMLGISLPLFPTMTDEEIEYVIDKVKEVIG